MRVNHNGRTWIFREKIQVLLHHSRIEPSELTEPMWVCRDLGEQANGLEVSYVAIDGFFSMPDFSSDAGSIGALEIESNDLSFMGYVAA